MNKRLDLLFESKDLIAIFKPAGLLSIPDRYNKQLPSVYSLLLEERSTVLPLHRLDKDTSGLLLFALHEEVHRDISLLFQNNLIHKTYHAIVEGNSMPDNGVLDYPIAHSTESLGKMIVHPKGKQSITYFKVLQRFKGFSLLQVEPKTGRTHQIRVHCSHVGMPIVADPLYGIRTQLSISDIKKLSRIKGLEEVRPLISRTALHAYSLHFSYLGAEFQMIAPYPKDFKASIHQLQKLAAL